MTAVNTRNAGLAELITVALKAYDDERGHMDMPSLVHTKIHTIPMREAVRAVAERLTRNPEIELTAWTARVLYASWCVEAGEDPNWEKFDAGIDLNPVGLNRVDFLSDARDAIGALPDAALPTRNAERTCATCHAVLADGPQPAATYEKDSTTPSTASVSATTGDQSVPPTQGMMREKEARRMIETLFAYKVPEMSVRRELAHLMAAFANNEVASVRAALAPTVPITTDNERLIKAFDEVLTWAFESHSWNSITTPDVIVRACKVRADIPCDRYGYDLRIEPCRECGSRGCPKKHACDQTRATLKQRSSPKKQRSSPNEAGEGGGG